VPVALACQHPGVVFGVAGFELVSEGLCLLISYDCAPGKGWAGGRAGQGRVGEGSAQQQMPRDSSACQRSLALTRGRVQEGRPCNKG
jgi:hypothetical protein